MGALLLGFGVLLGFDLSGGGRVRHIYSGQSKALARRAIMNTGRTSDEARDILIAMTRANLIIVEVREDPFVETISVKGTQS